MEGYDAGKRDGQFPDMTGFVSVEGEIERARFRMTFPPELKPERAMRVVSMMAESGSAISPAVELDPVDMFEFVLVSVGITPLVVLEMSKAEPLGEPLLGMEESVFVLLSVGRNLLTLERFLLSVGRSRLPRPPSFFASLLSFFASLRSAFASFRVDFRNALACFFSIFRALFIAFFASTLRREEIASRNSLPPLAFRSSTAESTSSASSKAAGNVSMGPIR